MTILEKIIAATGATVAARRRVVSRGQLEAMDGFARPVLNFEDALRVEGIAFIAESKRRSPSKGLLRDPYDPVAIVEGYAEAGAAAASVLTEPDFFDGAPEHLQAVRPSVPALPLLRKDFVVDEYQIYEARAWGADAVLLIAAALDRVQMRDLQDTAAGLGLHVLLELHSPFELDRVDFDRTRLVGVNHRDLHTFEVNLGHSQEIFSFLPEGIVRVAESGLRTADDIAEVARHGADAVLVGEAFMREADPGAALRDLREAVAERLGA